MKREIQAGKVDYTVLVFIPDPASTDGSGKTGLVAANLTVSYTRVETDNDVTVTDVTSSLNNLGALTTAHTDWGLLEVSNTLAPGLYRLDIADAVFASGAWTAVVYVMITTSAAAASPMEFMLVAHDPDDLGTKQSGDSYAVVNSGTFGNAALKTLIDAVDDFVDTEVSAIKTKTDFLPSVTAGAAGGLFIAGTNAATTITTALTTTFTGNLTGSAGSVTGAVGSVAAGGITAASFAANAINAAKLDPDVAIEIADAFLDRDMSTGTDSGSTTVRTPRQALRLNRNRVYTASGTQHVTKEDDTTDSWTAAVTTDAGALPIIEIDPA